MNDIIETFDDDALERGAFAEKITTAMKAFYCFSDGAYVLSLNGGFGTGKTTFLRMWKHQLESEGHIVLKINAWETDFCENPIIPIASALLEIEDKNVKKSMKALLGVVGKHAVKTFTGVDAESVLDDVSKITDSKDVLAEGDRVYQSYALQKRAYKEIHDTLEKYVNSNKLQKPIFIFVDELDRARPSYSVEFLETIKHIFAVKGICFVLAVDRKQLEASVRCLYGDIDFNNYYRRFISREASLPASAERSLEKLISQQMNRYFSENKLSNAFTNPKQVHCINEFASGLCRLFKLMPREIEDLIRTFAHYIALPSDTKATMQQDTAEQILFVITLSIKNPKIYELVSRGSHCSLSDYESSLNISSREHFNKDYILDRCNDFAGAGDYSEQRKKANKLITHKLESWKTFMDSN